MQSLRALEFSAVCILFAFCVCAVPAGLIVHVVCALARGEVPLLQDRLLLIIALSS